jgi:hypothetical protein
MLGFPINLIDKLNCRTIPILPTGSESFPPASKDGIPRAAMKMAANEPPAFGDRFYPGMTSEFGGIAKQSGPEKEHETEISHLPHAGRKDIEHQGVCRR